jgi:hypothetical protein
VLVYHAVGIEAGRDGLVDTHRMVLVLARRIVCDYSGSYYRLAICQSKSSKSPSIFQLYMETFWSYESL